MGKLSESAFAIMLTSNIVVTNDTYGRFRQLTPEIPK